MHTGKRTALYTAVILVLLALTCFASILLGSRRVPFHFLIDLITGKDRTSLEAAVLLRRVPRTVFGLLAGAALGVSGALMQAITKNPVADPSILGVNTGASLFVVCGISFLHITTASQYIWLALAGAGLTAVLVYGIASLGNGGATPLKLVLAGSAASVALGSLVSTVMLPNSNVMNSFRFWQVGSMGGATWDSIMLMLPFLAAGLVLAFVMAPFLNTLLLGDEMAAGLGVNPGAVRGLSALSGIVLCGATTALAGPIGFVGLMVPHDLRMCLGSDLRRLIPLSALTGAVLLLFSDIIGRLIGYPGETEAGIVMAMIGAPVFIAIVRKVRIRSL